MKTKCFYAGSFDPLTIGHNYVIEQSLSLFDQVVIAVGTNPRKRAQYMFTTDERVKLIRETFNDINNNHLSVYAFENEFAIKAAMRLNCTHIVRGIRNSADFEEEIANHAISSGIGGEFLSTAYEEVYNIPQLVFIPTPHNLANVSSSLVKSFIGFDQWQHEVSTFVSAPVMKALRTKFKEL